MKLQFLARLDKSMAGLDRETLDLKEYALNEPRRAYLTAP